MTPLLSASIRLGQDDAGTGLGYRSVNRNSIQDTGDLPSDVFNMASEESLGWLGVRFNPETSTVVIA